MKISALDSVFVMRPRLFDIAAITDCCFHMKNKNFLIKMKVIIQYLFYIFSSSASNFNVHERFKDDRASILVCFLERIFGSNHESISGRIDNVCLTIFKHVFQIHNGITCLRAFFNNVVECLFTSCNVLIWNIGTYNLTLELTAEILWIIRVGHWLNETFEKVIYILFKEAFRKSKVIFYQ